MYEGAVEIQVAKATHWGVSPGSIHGHWETDAAGEEIFLDLALNINDKTFGNKGIQFQYNNGAPRGYVGDGANAFWQHDGTKLTWKGANTELDASGNLTCTGGTIGGFTLAATTLTATNLILDSANQEIRLGSGNDIISLDAADATYRLAIGHATYGSAPFRVSKAGAVTATSGTIGGFTLAATTLTATNLLLDAGNQEIKLGSGNDIISLDAADATYRLAIGHATYGSAPFRISKAGAVTATSGTIGGWTLAADKLTVTGIELSQADNRIRAYTGANYVDMTAAGLTGYDSVLGTVFRLYTDGSAPEFSSGVIKECEYQVYTSGVIKTAADPSATGGLIINNTSLTAYNSDSSPVKLLEFIYNGSDEGDAYIGDYDNANSGLKYDHSTGELNIRGNLSVVSGGDITLAADDSTPGTINFVGSSYTLTMGNYDATGNSLDILPGDAGYNGLIHMRCGVSGNYLLKEFQVNTYEDVLLRSEHGDQETWYKMESTASQAGFYWLLIMDDGSPHSQYLNIAYTTAGALYFRPGTTDVWDLGGASNRWKSIYGVNIYGSTALWINETANAQMTTGITINQGAADNEILTFKSSDVAHGVTTVTETDTYGFMSKYGADGGLFVAGLTGTIYALYFRGISTTANSATATTAAAAVNVSSYLKSGTGVTSFAADDNIFTVRNGVSCKFLVKGDGDIYYDGADQGAYDGFDDALACADLSYNLSNQLGKVLQFNKERLHDMGVIACEGNDIFVSRKGMDMLQLGAIAELRKVTDWLCKKSGLSYEEARQLAS